VSSRPGWPVYRRSNSQQGNRTGAAPWRVSLGIRRSIKYRCPLLSRFEYMRWGRVYVEPVYRRFSHISDRSAAGRPGGATSR